MSGIRGFTENDLSRMVAIWNEIVAAGNAFPQEERLDQKEGQVFFTGQSFTGVFDEAGEILGLYILHPNNVGRCGHIANASYAVKSGQRGKRIGERLILHSMEKARELDFRILQFNAVTATNAGALHLYRKLGFSQLGRIPGGFRAKNGEYIDIIPHFIVLM
jgi:L-amino acid N-acyltransferase YncA